MNAFRNKVKTAPVLSSVKKTVSPAPSSPSTYSTISVKRTAEEDDFDDDYKPKKPAHDTTGSHLSTKLLLAVEYIKDRDAPVKVDALLSYLNINNDTQNSKLVSLVKNLDKIKYHEKDNTLEYVSIHNIKTKDDLLVFLRSQPTFRGISVKELKDGWNGCLGAINELEQEDKILVLRTKKDNHPRLVWANVGGELGAIDEEFVKIWLNVKLPERSELPGKLNKLGLKPASVDPATIKKDDNNAQIKKRKQRRGKITNTHMAGILKDYSNMR